MAVADLSRATTKYEAALSWSRFLVNDLIEKRENRLQALAPLLYVFELAEDGNVTLPSIGHQLSHPPGAEQAKVILSAYKDPFAYLVVLPGMPVPERVWTGPTYSVKKRNEIPICIPGAMIDLGKFDFYLMGAFISREDKRTFCSSFGNEKFGPVRESREVTGGALSNLCRIGGVEN